MLRLLIKLAYFNIKRPDSPFIAGTYTYEFTMKYVMSSFTYFLDTATICIHFDRDSSPWIQPLFTIAHFIRPHIPMFTFRITKEISPLLRIQHTIQQPIKIKSFCTKHMQIVETKFYGNGYSYLNSECT